MEEHVPLLRWRGALKKAATFQKPLEKRREIPLPRVYIYTHTTFQKEISRLTNIHVRFTPMLHVGETEQNWIV